MFNKSFNIWELVPLTCCESKFEPIYQTILRLDADNLTALEQELELYSGRPLHVQIKIRINIRREQLEKQNG